VLPTTIDTPDNRKALIILRKLTGDAEHDNLVLDGWFTKQGYSAKDSEFDVIYVNGGNNLENLKTPDDRWKVRLIEEDFHRLTRIADGLGGELAKLGMRAEHDEDRLTNDDARSPFARELRMERVAERLIKRRRLRQIDHGDVEEDLFVHGS